MCLQKTNIMLETNNLNTDDLEYLKGKFNTEVEELETKIAKDTTRLNARITRGTVDAAAIADAEADLATEQEQLQFLTDNGAPENLVINQQQKVDGMTESLNQLITGTAITPREVAVVQASIAILEAERVGYQALLDQIEGLL